MQEKSIITNNIHKGATVALRKHFLNPDGSLPASKSGRKKATPYYFDYTARHRL